MAASKTRRVVATVLVAPFALIALVLIASRIAASAREDHAAREVAPREGRTTRAGIYFEERGEGRPLVLVHGTMAWSGTFRPLMERLAAAGYRAIAIDLPPFGYSDRPIANDYGRRAQALRIGAVLDELALEDVVLLGHSFGAGATVEAAMTRPDRVTGLALLAGALSLDELGRGEHAGTPLPLAFPPLRDAIVATVVTNPGTTGAILRSMMVNDAVVTEERIAIYQRPFDVEGLTPAVGAWVETGLLADERGAVSAFEPAYRAYMRPVLLVWGAGDTVTPIAQGRELSRILPQDRLVELDHVGHIPHVEDLDRVSSALVDWLGATSATHR